MVIVTYRSAALTIACLQSLERERAGSALNIRAIVVDNASGDIAEISSAVAQRGWSAWVTLVAAPENGG
ncbi:MAG: glycosyltransferase family 2 protein, partial [Gammaproteobacteria bacterium]|nr:glycosyltransferase family 2 protein [Gammaproteobacteria bacterium]